MSKEREFRKDAEKLLRNAARRIQGKPSQKDLIEAAAMSKRAGRLINRLAWVRLNRMKWLAKEGYYSAPKARKPRIKTSNEGDIP